MTESFIRIPLGGNAFLETPASGGIVTERGVTNWHDASAVFGIYIRFRRAVTFRAVLRMRPQTREATVRLSLGDQSREAVIPAGADAVSFGEYAFPGEGYARFELSGVS